MVERLSMKTRRSSCSGKSAHSHHPGPVLFHFQVFPTNIWDPQPRSKACTTWIQPEPTRSKVRSTHRAHWEFTVPYSTIKWYSTATTCRIKLVSVVSNSDRKPVNVQLLCIRSSMSTALLHFRNHPTMSMAQVAFRLCHLVPKRCPSATLPAWSYLLPQLPQRNFESVWCACTTPNETRINMTRSGCIRHLPNIHPFLLMF